LKLVLLVFVLTFNAFFCKADVLSNLSELDRTLLQKEIRTYLLSHPEIIMEALKSLEDKNSASNADLDKTLIQANYEAIFEDDSSWQGGNLNGDITIVEFIDYRCGYCRKAHNEIKKLINLDQNIRIIIKEYPILGRESNILSRLAVSVLQLYGPKKYQLIHNEFITNKINLSEANIKNLLERMDLDSTEILNHINSKEVTDHLIRTRELGKKLKINGTPTFILEDTMIRGYVEFDYLAAEIERIR